MNDFTKEELKELMYCVAHYQSCKWSNPELLQLESKIKSMIETYSELKPPTMADYCCQKCNEEWHQCGCKDA